MIENNKKQFLVRSEQYARISEQAYSDYLSAKNTYLNIEKIVSYEEDPIKYLKFLLVWHNKMDDAGITALVFQAMAIESYTNLMGAYLTNEVEFYKNLERAPIEKKLKGIFKQLGFALPEKLISRIRCLFDLRNDLVHQKPKSYYLNISPNNIDAFFQENSALTESASLAFSNVEENIHLYSELKDTLQTLRGTQFELLDEIFFKDEGEK